jgi:hypothetical protein
VNSTKKIDPMRLVYAEALLKKQLVPVRIQGSFDLLLIVRNKIILAELQALSDFANKTPVLVKKGKKIIMYGDSGPDSEGWRIISLKNCDVFYQLPFPEKQDDFFVFVSSEEVPSSIYAKLLLQQGHVYFKFSNRDSADLHSVVERCFTVGNEDKFFLLWSRIENKLPHVTTQIPVSLTAKELDIVIAEIASSSLSLNTSPSDSFDDELAAKEYLPQDDACINPRD